MEAKDTVMSGYDGLELDLIKAQAEISFRAGIEEVQSRLQSPEALRMTKEALTKARLRGIREVVEWLKAHDWYCSGIHLKLKEWGIDNV